MQGGQEVLLTAVVPALVADALQRFGAARLKVAGTSMLPALRPRDVLLVERREIHQIQVGDIVLFALSHRLIVHRVIRTGIDAAGAPTLVTRGDTHRDEDLPISADQVLGQIVSLRRHGRRHASPFRYSRAASLGALAAARCLHLARRLGPRLLAAAKATPAASLR